MQHRRRLAIFQAAKRASFTGKPVAPTTPQTHVAVQEVVEAKIQAFGSAGKAVV